MGSASARAAQADHRTVRLQEVLRARWRDETNRKPPAEREKFLRSTEGIVALGAKVCSDLLKEIERRRQRVRDLVPGRAWLEAWENRQQLMPLLAFTSKGSLVPRADGRKHSVRLQLSRAKVRSGIGGFGFVGATTGSRRLTPPQAVELEDFLDELTPDEAVWGVAGVAGVAERGGDHADRGRAGAADRRELVRPCRPFGNRKSE